MTLTAGAAVHHRHYSLLLSSSVSPSTVLSVNDSSRWRWARLTTPICTAATTNSKSSKSTSTLRWSFYERLLEHSNANPFRSLSPSSTSLSGRDIHQDGHDPEEDFVALVEEITENFNDDDDDNHEGLFILEEEEEQQQSALQREQNRNQSVEIPANILGTMVAPYLSHRPTYNSLSETCTELSSTMMMMSSIGGEEQPSSSLPQQQQQPSLPPWPESVLRTSNGNSLWSVSFSPDHAVLVAGGNDGSIRLWHRVWGPLFDIHEDATIRKSQQSLKRAHLGRIYSIVFDPDSNYMASGSGDGAIKLWEYKEGMKKTVDILNRRVKKRRRRWQSKSQSKSPRRTEPQLDRHPVTDNQKSGDDDDDDDDDGICGEEIWDGVFLTTDSSSQPHTHVNCLAFNPSGQILASSGDTSVRLWDVRAKACIAALRQDDISVVESVAFSPDGQILAAGNWSSKITLWDVDNRSVVGSIVESSTCVHSVCFSPTCPNDKNYNPSSSSISSSPVAAKFDLCSATDESQITVWRIREDVDTNDDIGNDDNDDDHDHNVHLTVTSATIEIPNPQQQHRQRQVHYTSESNASLVGHSDTIWSVAFSPSHIASASGDGTCRVWNASSGRCMMILNQQRNDDVENNEGDDEEDDEDEYHTTSRSYRPFFRRNQRRQREPSSSVYSVSFSPCGGYVAASRADGTVELRSLM